MSPAFLAAEMALFEQQAAEVDIIITVSSKHDRIEDGKRSRGVVQLTPRRVSVCVRCVCSHSQTANIPGKPAPKLITAKCARMMRAGSVIVDLAAEAGGNCELTRRDETYVDEQSGVTIVGLTNLTSLLADQSSTLYATNLKNLLLELGGALKFNVDRENDIVGPMVVVTDGQVVWQSPQSMHAPAPLKVSNTSNANQLAASVASPPGPSPSPTAPPHAVQHPDTVHSPTVTLPIAQPVRGNSEVKDEHESKNGNGASSSSSSSSSPPVISPPVQARQSSSERDRLLGPNAPATSSYSSTQAGSVAIDVDPEAGRGGSSRRDDDPHWWAWVLLQVAVLTVFFALVSRVTPAAFHLQLLVFVLSVVVGYNLVWSVTPALHTPLMSVTNAISGIIILGLMLQTSGKADSMGVILALIGIGFTSVNIFGGFIVTQKMLAMFQK